MNNEFAQEMILVSNLNSGFTLEQPIQNYSIQFNKDGKVVGTLNFNVSPPTFEGDTEGTARLFFDWVIEMWPHLLKERQEEMLKGNVK